MPEHLDDLPGTDNQLLVSALLECVCEDVNVRNRLILANSVRVNFTFQLIAYLEKVCGFNTPERLQIFVYCVIFVRKLDVVFYNILPPGNDGSNIANWSKKRRKSSPEIESFWRKPIITSPVLLHGLFQRFAGSRQLSFPFLFSSRYEFIYWMRTLLVKFEQTIRSVSMPP